MNGLQVRSHVFSSDRKVFLLEIGKRRVVAVRIRVRRVVLIRIRGRGTVLIKTVVFVVEVRRCRTLGR